MEFPGEKLVIKLWETLAEKGIGSLLAPWQTLREGRARNEVRRQGLLMLAQAKTDVADLRAGRKRLRSDGTLLLVANDGSNEGKANAEVGDRIEPTLGLPDAIRQAAITNAANSARTEINSAKAVLYAEEQLANDTQAPPDRVVDEDWLFAWRGGNIRVNSPFSIFREFWGQYIKLPVI